MAKKGKREVIVFACEVCGSRNYTSTKNKQKHPQRLQLRKFCPSCGKHTNHKEAK